MSRNAPGSDLEAFRADQDAASIMRTRAPMSGEHPRQGMLDTNILILRPWIDPAELPDEMAISAITLAESPAGRTKSAAMTSRTGMTNAPSVPGALRSCRRDENEFDPVPFDTEAARIFGRVSAAVIATGRRPRRRVVDLMIASTAIAEGLPLYTTNPDDFAGLTSLVPIMRVTQRAGPARKTELTAG